jgi:tRNA pseudouridine38-40 synthase
VRLRIDLAYDGTDFHGWAVQPTLRTVQGELTAALATVLRSSADELRVVCAGRTDAGVHARGQVTHVEVADNLAEDDLSRLERRLNGVLLPDARVHRVAVAPEGFDARFSAQWRRYAYRIADDPALVDPLRRRHVLSWPRALDLDAMNAAAAPLVGLNDFAAFCKQRPGATTIRTLLELSWSRDDSGVAVGHVKADAFCHSMVRALVGCLVAVGDGRRPPEWAHQILTARERDPSVAVLHAHGLTLEEVAYPPVAELAARAVETAARRESAEADA